jgi:aspartate racemase
MKTVGIIGGLGPESTIDYYRLLISSYQKQSSDNTFPSIFINSLDVNKGLRMLEANELGELTDYLVAGVQKLADAGADFGLISANSPHLVFAEVQSRSSLPLISIVEAAAAAAGAKGISKAALLGTRFTMQAQFFPDVFSKAEIALAVPTEDEQAYIHDKYVNELLKGIFLPATRERLLDIIQRMRVQERIEAVLLAGTELPLILRAQEAAGVPLLDTTQIHVEAAVARLLS